MKPAIICFGEVLLRLSSPGKELLLQSPRFDAHIGGAEANVAVSLHKFGHRTRVVERAARTRRSAARAPMSCAVMALKQIRFISATAAWECTFSRTARAIVRRKCSTIARILRSPSRRRPLMTGPSLLANARWLHVSGITPAVSAATAEAASQAMQAARKAGVQISFDCNFRARLWGSRAPEAPQLLTRLCEQADVIFGDDRDIAFMLGFKASAADARREAADVAFKSFKHLRYIVCTERARHSVDVQQLTGLLFDSKNTYTSRSYPSAQHRRSHRRRRRVRWRECCMDC